MELDDAPGLRSPAELGLTGAEHTFDIELDTQHVDGADLPVDGHDSPKLPTADNNPSEINDTQELPTSESAVVEAPIETSDTRPQLFDLLHRQQEIKASLTRRMQEDAAEHNTDNAEEVINESMEEGIARIKAENAERDRARRQELARQRQQAHDSEEEALFVSDGEDEDYNFAVESDAEDSPTTTTAKGKKRARCDGEQQESNKKPRKAPAARKPGRPKGSTNKTARKVKKPDPRANRNTVQSIMGSNVFDDVQRTAGLEAQPTFSGDKKTRADALQSLIASLSQDEKADARSDRIRLDNAIRDIDGARSIKAGVEEGWLLRGMKTQLKHYQVMAVAFMRNRENGSKKPYGGILADGMGLGKTVEILANIVNGQRSMKTEPRPTLIVLPAALVGQWQAEIQKHVYTKDEVTNARATFGAGSEEAISAKWGLKKLINYKDIRCMPKAELIRHMEKQDVVITTYNCVLSSYPRMKPPAECRTSKQKNAWYKTEFEEKAGTLHRIKWRRVVLDEAHLIKNHCSNTSLACRALKAEHYWAVTGTPVQNNLGEFYAYFRFIRCPVITSFRLFNVNFCNLDDADATKKLLIMLNDYMIRRTHADTFFARKLVDIPKPETPTTMKINFNVIERKIYDIIHHRYVDKINTMARAGNIGTQYKNIYTLLLRLRQATAHVLLLHDALIDILDRSDFEKLSKPLTDKEMTEDGTTTLLQLRAMLTKVAIQRKSSDEERNIVVTQSNAGLEELKEIIEPSEEMIGWLHGTELLDFAKYVKTLGQGESFEKIKENTKCSACHNEPIDAHITDCEHVYCLSCLDGLQTRAARIGRDHAACMSCGHAFKSVNKCVEPDQESKTTMNDGNHEKHTNTVLGKGKSKQSRLNAWLKMGGAVAPSAKTIAMKSQILQWLADDPDTKIIIYSQFIPLLHIISKVCEMEQWSFRSYRGDMTTDARNKSIHDFADPELKITCLLASMKCGGLGLNLTAASKVLIMDSWWNDSVEQQAFCRVFRHGQDKTTELTRLVVRGTIDEDMMNMKDRKLKEINPILEDPERHDASKLSVTELLALFGRVGEDDKGNPFIFADPEDAYDEDDHLRVIEDDSGDEFRAMGEDA